MTEGSQTMAQLIDGYVEGLSNGKLMIPRCKKCNEWNWYPRDMCLHCGSSERELVEIRPKGTVFSWTRVRRALPPVQELETPYVVILVELSDATGVRVACRAATANVDPIIGQSIALHVSSSNPPYLIGVDELKPEDDTHSD
jgi:uncharacterized OB-fold protein